MKIDRKYRVRFSINIGDSEDRKFANYLKFYIKKWSEFFSQINRLKLSSLPNNGTTSVRELPEIRDFLKTNNLQTQQIISLLNQKRPELARMLLETAPLFDHSPIALKAHIIAVFGVTELELRNLSQ